MRARNRFFSATQTPSFVPAATGQRSYTKANVAFVVFIMLAVACVVIATRAQQPTNTVERPVAKATAIAPTPIAMTPPIAVGVPVQHDTNMQDIGTALHVWLNDMERAAVAKVYPRPEPILAGVDPACYYADKQGVSCSDVKAAVAQMLEWHTEGDQ